MKILGKKISSLCFLATKLCYIAGLSSRASGFHTVVGSAGFTNEANRIIILSQASATAQVQMSSLPRGSKPLREIEKPRPKLWIYDHCPYCVRARMIFGLKGIAHDLAFLSNDDVETPSSMMGKKMVPILELGRPGSEDHEVMPESLDIVRRVDEDPVFGEPVLAPASKRTDLSEWLDSVATIIRRLTYPRNAATPLAEFQTRSARDTYARNHPLPGPRSSYSENLQDSPALVEQLERELWVLEPMIHSAKSVTAPGSTSAGSPAKMSYDDIVFFPKMRSVTIVRGLGIPPKLRAYLDTVSELCDIPLYDKFAS